MDLKRAKTLTSIEAQKRNYILKKINSYYQEKGQSYPYKFFFLDVCKNKEIPFNSDELEVLLEKISTDGFVEFEYDIYMPEDPQYIVLAAMQYIAGIKMNYDGIYFIDEGGYSGILEYSTLKEELNTLQKQAVENSLEDRDLDLAVKKSQKTYFNIATWNILFKLILFISGFLIGYLVK